MPELADLAELDCVADTGVAGTSGVSVETEGLHSVTPS